MKPMKSLQFAMVAPACLSLVLAVACGGKDDTSPGGSAGSAGSAGTSTGSGGSSGSSGTNKGGSSGNSKGGSSGTSKGGSSSSGGGNFSTSVPGDKELGELTPAEVEQLCDDLEQFTEDLDVAAASQEFSCRATGLFAGLSDPQSDETVQAACKVAYDECMASPPEPTTPGECSAPDASCTATVDEFEACMSDAKATFDELATALPSCEELSLADLGSLGGEQPMSPASCTTFQEKCPSGPAVPGM